jgi:hypothetical protein
VVCAVSWDGHDGGVFKRITWWIVGAAMGSAGSAYAQRRVKKAVRNKAAALAPSAVIDAARNKLKSAVADGKNAARAKERDLKGRISGSG